MASNQNNAVLNRKRPGDDGLFGTDDGIPFGALGIAPLGFLAPPADTGRPDHGQEMGKNNPAKNGHASRFSGSAENFQNELVGNFTYSSFPTGWFDLGAVGPHSDAPNPSAVVIKTTDADGHSTKALAMLPAVAGAQGIYRPIEASNYYSTYADVRIDQFGDTDPTGAVEDPNRPGFLLCGCPVGTEDLLDWPIAVGFLNVAANPTNPAELPIAAIAASSETHTWHLFAVTANILADIDLGLTPEEGKWYGVEVDLDALNGVLHGVITDAANGTILADRMVFLNPVSPTDPNYGEYDPTVDGVFDTEMYMDSELTLLFGTNPDLNKPGLAVIDNIDWQHPGNGNAFGYGHENGSAHSIWSAHGSE